MRQARRALPARGGWPWKRRVIGAVALVALSALFGPLPSIAQSLRVASALQASLRGTRASGVVLAMGSGAVLATAGPRRRGTPGSAIKPLLLAYALDHGLIRPDTAVYCHRTLTIGDRMLPCTHPADRTVFTAETALAASCNTWFAELGRRFPGLSLDAALEQNHLAHVALATASVEDRQMAVLGLRGVTASPLELARAYRVLLHDLSSASPGARGLEGSVADGMAHPAAVRGLEILGKTGTASNPGEAWTHGWFAGALPGRVVVVMFVPHGDGGTAARLAQTFFRSFGAVGIP